MREHRGRPFADAGGERRLLGEAGGDLLGRAAGDAEAGRGELLFDRAADAGRARAGERPVVGRGDGAAVGGARDQGAEAPGVAEGAGEPPPPRGVEVERVEHRGEQARIADPHHRPRDAEEGGGIEGEAEHVGVGGVAVGAAERLDAGLEELVRLVGALPEDRAEIGVAGLPPRRSGGEVMERDGDGEVRPERHLDAVLVGGEEEAAAEILAEQLDEHARVIDDRRLDEAVTGVGEKRAKGLIGLGHWRRLVPRVPRRNQCRRKGCEATDRTHASPAPEPMDGVRSCSFPRRRL